MIGLALRLFGLIASPFNGVVKWCVTHPMTCLCVILACYGLYERHRAAGWQNYAHKLERASQEAQRAQDAMRAQEEATYERQASDADAKHVAALDSVRDAVGVYLRTHRLLPSRISPASGIGSASTAGIHETVPADNVSAISDTDLQRCADATAYAIQARDWALTITAPVVP